MAKDSRKKELLKAWKDQERQKLIASIPIPHSDLRDLFDLLDRENAPKKCDRTLRVTIDFLQQRGLDVDLVVPWLHEHGGCCDCEVLLNVEEVFAEIIGQSD